MARSLAFVIRKPRSRKSVVLTFVVAIVVGLAGFLGVLYTTQRSLMYQFDSSPVRSLATYAVPGEDVVLPTDDGLQLKSWLLTPKGGPAAQTQRKMAVLYLPGNGGNREGRLGLGEALAARGFTVLLMDYRGAGGNPGSPTQAGLHLDAQAGLAALVERGFDASHILYVGESLGAGVAVQLAAAQPPAGVVLRSPFSSMDDEVASVMPLVPTALVKDHFRSDLFIADVEVPVQINYTDSDEVVPAALSKKLGELAPNLAGSVNLPGSSHNDPQWFGAYFADQVLSFAGQLEH